MLGNQPVNSVYEQAAIQSAPTTTAKLSAKLRSSNNESPSSRLNSARYKAVGAAARGPHQSLPPLPSWVPAVLVAHRPRRRTVPPTSSTPLAVLQVSSAYAPRRGHPLWGPFLPRSMVIRRLVRQRQLVVVGSVASDSTMPTPPSHPHSSYHRAHNRVCLPTSSPLSICTIRTLLGPPVATRPPTLPLQTSNSIRHPRPTLHPPSVSTQPNPWMASVSSTEAPFRNHQRLPARISGAPCVPWLIQTASLPPPKAGSICTYHPVIPSLISPHQQRLVSDVKISPNFLFVCTAICQRLHTMQSQDIPPTATAILL